MEQEQVVQLINLYRNYTYLWNRRDKYYHNKNKREDAWKEIASALEVPMSTLKLKMKTLMGTYRSEKSRERKSRATRAGGGEVYDSKWFAFKYFDFLSERDNPRETIDTTNDYSVPEENGARIITRLPYIAEIVPQENKAEEATMFLEKLEASLATLEETTFPTPSSSGFQSRKKNNSKGKRSVDKINQIMDDAVKIWSYFTAVTNDPFYIYGQHIANELRKYDPQTLAHVKRAFSDILFEADLGRLHSMPMGGHYFQMTPDIPSPQGNYSSSSGAPSPKGEEYFIHTTPNHRSSSDDHF